MMIMKTRQILWGAIVAGVLSSCSNYLDIKPYDKVIPETAEDFAALIHYRLNQIDEGSDDDLIPSFSTTVSYDSGYGDDFEVCLTGTGGTRLPNYVGSSISSNGFNNNYSGLYEIIRDCNIVIHEMKESGTAEADNLLATAYAMRGVAYYQLLRLFCEVPQPGGYDSQLGVPVVTMFDMEAKPVRSSMAGTIEAIESDLKRSISYGMNEDIYRFTEDVVRGYLARLYFWSRQWDKCLETAQDMLVKYPLLDIDPYKAMMSSGSGALTGNQLIKAYRSISVSGNNSMSGSINSLSYRPVSLRFLSHFPDSEKAADVRYAMYVNTKRQACKGIFCGMRAAEFALMEAEALYHLGRREDALASINKLRRHRIIGYTDLEMDNLPAVNAMEIISVDVEGDRLTPLMALILSERRKELFLEYDRWFELKRNGAPQFSAMYNGVKYTTMSYMYTFPIPIRDLDLNPGLVQNTGYDEIINR